MIKLYGGSRSRASIIQWYLEELAIPYEFVMLDMAAGEHLQPDFLKINPMGKVPAIEDSGITLWESGAILLYLAEKYAQPGASLAERSVWGQWTLFANSTLANGLFLEDSREKETPRLLQGLSGILEQHPFILGQQFTVVDAAVGSMLAYVTMMLPVDFSPYPVVLKYINQIKARPAFQKTIGNR